MQGELRKGSETEMTQMKDQLTEMTQMKDQLKGGCRRRWP